MSFGGKGLKVMIKLYSFLLAFSLLPGWIIAQNEQDTTSRSYNLEVVEISANRLQFAPEINIQKFDEAVLQLRNSQGLQTLLSDYANVNIRSYGYGGLSNVSMRGANSNHTAVLWNGFNLQDPLNGGTNLLLFPLFFVDNISVQKGGSAALFGSGAMGGSISLTNNLSFNQGLGIGIFASAGSFENTQIGTSVRWSGKKAVFLLKAFQKQGKNNFPFTNTEQFGTPQMRQNNAELRQWGILQENAFQIGKNQILNTHLWIQQTDHNLPPNMTVLNSQQNQLDQSIRGSLDWTYYAKKWQLTLRNGSFFNQLDYSDPTTKIYSSHKSISNITELEGNFKIRKQKDVLNVGINSTYEQGLSESYGKNKSRNRIAVFSSYLWQFSPQFSFTASGRKEYVDQRFTPFTFALKLSAKKMGDFRFLAQYAQNYRIPTFNDLFWYDGMAKGNPDLKDESSWNMEVGLGYLKKTGIGKFMIKTSLFNSYFINLIQWVPVQAIWTPQNQQEVWSRGAELQTNYSYQSKKWLIKLGGSYSYIKSTLERKANNEPESILHKQLILTPIHQGNINFKLQYKTWGIEYLQDIVGRQYITADHNDRIKRYTLGNIVLSWQGQIFDQLMSASFRWNNIWNTVYQTMPSYAMPLSNFDLNFQYNFNRKKP